MPRMNPEEVARRLRRLGFEEDRRDGGHIKLRHPVRGGLVSLSRHRSQTMTALAVGSILRQAGVSVEEFLSGRLRDSGGVGVRDASQVFEIS